MTTIIDQDVNGRIKDRDPGESFVLLGAYKDPDIF
jgi:hypothetical protein